jgi:hypothetical protein
MNKMDWGYFQKKKVFYFFYGRDRPHPSNFSGAGVIAPISWPSLPPGQKLDTYSKLGEKIERKNSTLFHQGLNIISPGTNFFLSLVWRLRANYFFTLFFLMKTISTQVFDEFTSHNLSGFIRKSTVKKYFAPQDSTSNLRRPLTRGVQSS